jgi:hypothetical protein
MPTFIYRGNPGYEYPAIGVGTLNPGDEVELTQAQADELGDDFEPKSKSKTKPPAGADTEEP